MSARLQWNRSAFCDISEELDDLDLYCSDDEDDSPCAVEIPVQTTQSPPAAASSAASAAGRPNCTDAVIPKYHSPLYSKQQLPGQRVRGAKSRAFE